MQTKVLNTEAVSDMDNQSLSEFLKKNGMSLTVEEVRKVCGILGRDPTLTELHIFNTEWSEHCSYKSSKTLFYRGDPS